MLTIEIHTTSAAFEDPGLECARILRVISMKLMTLQVAEGPAIDCNGDTVGFYTLTER